MRKKGKIRLSIGIIFLLIVINILLLHQSSKKTTYIEYTEIGQTCNNSLSLINNETIAEQEFSMPYQLFYGFGFYIGTYGRDNNSTYEAIITDKTDHEIIVTKQFNTSMADDNQIYNIMLDSAIEVDTTHQFSLTIKAKSLVNAENGIAIYVDEESRI